MPELLEYPTDPGQLDKLDREELAERKQAIEEAWDYYEGRHKRPLRVKPGEPDDNVVVNVCRKTVDQGISLLFGVLPSFEIGDQGDQPEDERLEEIWQANDKSILLHNIALAGALAGHVFVKVWPDEQRGARFVLLNPRFVSVFWRPDDMEQIIAYKIAFELGDEEVRQDIVNEGNTWLLRDMRRSRGRPWTIVEEARWGFPWAPLVDWQNMPDPEAFYGDPDLVRPELNDSLNLIASNTMRILKYHAHPKTIMTGGRANEVQETAVDGFWSVPNSDAKIENLEMQSDLGSSLAYLQLLQQWFFSEHRGVDMSVFARDLGQITNFGLRTLFKDAIDKLETKRRLYEKALADMSERALALVGMVGRPTVNWGDPLPFNDAEEIASIQAEIGLGILSKETAASLRGRDWEQEQERIEEEAAGEDNIGARLLQAFERGQ